MFYNSAIELLGIGLFCFILLILKNGIDIVSLSIVCMLSLIPDVMDLCCFFFSFLADFLGPLSGFR